MTLSSPSYSEWTKVRRVASETFYLDIHKIKKQNGYIYFWDLVNHSKPSLFGIQSIKTYVQGDCKLFRIKYLKHHYHNKPMGKGTPQYKSNDSDINWKYPPPNSTNGALLEKICTQLR